jgi:predicted dienelactone hydrolase
MRPAPCLPVMLAAMFALSPAAAEASGPVCDAQWNDPGRDGRAIPIRIRMPDGAGKVPVILFSHGLGGSTDSGRAWADAWAASGFLVVNLQHPGSDRSIIAGGRIREAMRPEQLAARVGDVRFAIDRLAGGGRDGACDLSRADVSRIGMSGHSYGAHTTQAIAGQRFDFGNGDLSDRRVRAAIAFSPAPPLRGSAKTAFAGIHIPFFSITGTADSAPITPWIKAADRETPFRSMPAGGKYLLVLDGANHMAFNGRGDRAATGAALTPHVEDMVTRATIAFWRSTLLGDQAAKATLERGLPLASGDRLERR